MYHIHNILQIDYYERKREKLMQIGDLLTVKFGDKSQELIVVSKTEPSTNGTNFYEYNFTYGNVLYVRHGFTVSNPLDIKGHNISSCNEIKDGDFYLKVNASYALPL